MGLGARLASLRQAKGQSLQDVADAVAVSKAHIWELEKGRTKNPSMQLVERLADHFGVSVASLVGEDPRADDAKPEIARMFRRAEKMHPEDLALLDQMMQLLIRRRNDGDSSPA